MSGRRIDYFDDPDAPRPTRIVPGVSVAVINDLGQLLMIRRTDNDQWAIPGGAQEVGETPLEAARREVREETGITCEITGLVGIFSSPRNVVEFTSDGEVRQEFSILFSGYPRSEDLATSSESREVAWHERDDVLALPMTPAQRRRIRYLLESRRDTLSGMSPRSTLLSGSPEAERAQNWSCGCCTMAAESDGNRPA